MNREQSRPSVRPERAGDAGAIRRVHVEAFGGETEADLVDAIRRSDHWEAALSLVAEDRGEIVGHVLCSWVDLTGEPAAGTVEPGPRTRRVLSLAPVGVLPERQRTGIGTALTAAVLDEARRLGAALVVVLGHADYYPRFGFVRASSLGIASPFPVPDEAFMALPLDSYEPGLRGTVVYPPAFDEV